METEEWYCVKLKAADIRSYETRWISIVLLELDDENWNPLGIDYNIKKMEQQ